MDQPDCPEGFEYYPESFWKSSRKHSKERVIAKDVSLVVTHFGEKLGGNSFIYDWLIDLCWLEV